MKHVAILDAEPAELAAWRTENPEDDRATDTNATEAWERFKSSGAYMALVRQLLTRQQGLCAYCEQRLCRPDGSLAVNDYQVEHVLAKSGGPGRVLYWQNLMLCCGGGTWKHHKDASRYLLAPRGKKNVSCGQAKGDADIDGPCDPRSLPWQEPIVRVDIDGRMRPDPEACRRHGIDTDALGRVIQEVLALNCERLRIARQEAVKRIEEELNVLFEWLFDESHLPEDRLEQAYQFLVEGRLRPDPHRNLRRFWTTERIYLGKAAEAWIHANKELFYFR
jgi:uncharacterized protein (TIGR02646 family)